MTFRICPHCATRVLPMSDGRCPSCRRHFEEEPSEKPLPTSPNQLRVGKPCEIPTWEAFDFRDKTKNPSHKGMTRRTKGIFIVVAIAIICGAVIVTRQLSPPKVKWIVYYQTFDRTGDAIFARVPCEGDIAETLSQQYEECYIAAGSDKTFADQLFRAWLAKNDRGLFALFQGVEPATSERQTPRASSSQWQDKELARRSAKGLIVDLDSFSVIPQSFTVGPKNRRVAFVSESGAKHIVVLDGRAGKAYDGIAPDSLVFSLDGRTLAFVAQLGSKQLVVVNGIPQEQYDGVGNPLFSQDSQRIAYVAERDGRQFAVVDGKEQTAYDGIGEGRIFFSPDGKRVAYAVDQEGGQFVVIDAKEGERYDGVGHPIIFSSDSKRVGYSCRSGVDWSLVVDGNREGGYPQIRISQGLFGPNSDRLAYVARTDRKMAMIVDGKKHTEYDFVGEPLFSRDGQRLIYLAMLGEKWMCITDGTEGRKYDGIMKGHPIFSSDGKRIAYVAKDNSQWVVVIDEKEIATHPEIVSLVFSPEGKTIAYTVQEGNQQFVVVEGKHHKRYAGVRDLVFSPDGKHLTYHARGQGKEFVILDGRRLAEHKTLLRKGRPAVVFDSATSLHYLAFKENAIHLVEKRIE